MLAHGGRVAPSPPDRARPRPFTLLLRLLPRQGSLGRLVGHAEVIDTNERVPISSEQDLIDLVRRLSTTDDLVE